MDMHPQRWAYTNAYLRAVFGQQDEQLDTLMDRAVAAGLPAIAISPDVGRLLHLLASMTNAGRGPRLVIEVGTLAGYSGIWLARALAPGGRLITIEANPLHADFAQREFETAGLADRVEIRRGPGLEVLPQLASELPAGSADVLFLDAIKTANAAYLAAARPLLAVGGLLLVDNTLGSGQWWIDDGPGTNADRDAVDAFNRQIAADRGFEATCVPARQGVLMARRVR